MQPAIAAEAILSCWRRRPDAWLRVGLVPVFVGLCYAFSWHTWRACVTAALLPLLADSANGVVSLSSDTFSYCDRVFQVGLSCTAVDVFFGSIPLLWQFQRRPGWNLALLATYFVALSGVNLVRLAVGFRLYALGVPWFLAHELMSGLFYFAVFVCIARWGFAQPARRSSFDGRGY